jgi:hypothetical protein
MVVLVLAIAAAIVVPAFSESAGMQAMSAARIIASDIEYAQSLAVTRQEPMTIGFFPDQEKYGLYDTSGLLEHPIDHKDYLVDFAADARGFGSLDVVSAEFGGSSNLSFDELGSPIAGGRVTLQAGSQVYHVDVAAVTGKVTVTRSGS